jgi:serine protease Do
MKSKVILVTSIVLISIVVNLATQFFVWPRLSTIPFFARYQLEGRDEKTIIINKTEKITVKEEFSLTKPAEKIMPAITRVYFIPKKKVTDGAIKLNIQSSTGVILSGDGVIATTFPEFNLEDKVIKVFLADDREFTAEVKNEDIFNGLLILKIKADNLPVAPFGESNNLHNGEKLILSGQSVSDNRPIFALRTIQEHTKDFNKKGLEFLYSDENSEVFILDNVVDQQFVGGPAVDFNGTVVGLISSVKNINGEISFIIPFENVKKSIDNAFNERSQQGNIFGVYYLNINNKLKKINKLSVDQGALVYSSSGKNGLAVVTKSIGRGVGLRINDIITHINGIEINNENTLSEILAIQNLDEEIKINIIRNEKELELKTKK